MDLEKQLYEYFFNLNSLYQDLTVKENYCFCIPTEKPYDKKINCVKVLRW